MTSLPENEAITLQSCGDASGVKHRVIHSSMKPDVSPTGRLTTADTTDYVGKRVYLNGKLDKILTPYGYLQGGKFHTWLHDYQGNIVAVVVGGSVAQRNSYYPYGLPHVTGLIKLQSPSATSVTVNPYKYGGKEYDTFGGADLYDFHARYHAPSTGRFMTVDPMAEKYPGISPYMYCAGNPIAYIDPDGMQIFVNIDDMIYYYREIEKGRYGLVDEDGNEYKGNDKFAKAVVNALRMLQKGDNGNRLVLDLVENNHLTRIAEWKSGNFFRDTESNPTGCSTIYWDPDNDYGGINEKGYKMFKQNIYCPAFVQLGHEMAHNWDFLYGDYDCSVWLRFDDGQAFAQTEFFACYYENLIRAEHSLPIRTHYARTDKLNPIEMTRVSYMIGNIPQSYISINVSPFKIFK